MNDRGKREQRSALTVPPLSTSKCKRTIPRDVVAMIARKVSPVVLLQRIFNIVPNFWRGFNDPADYLCKYYHPTS